MHETETQTRLRRAKESLASCQESENTARTALVLAEASRKRAREKYETAFLANEKNEVARRRAEFNRIK